VISFVAATHKPPVLQEGVRLKFSTTDHTFEYLLTHTFHTCVHTTTGKKLDDTKPLSEYRSLMSKAHIVFHVSLPAASSPGSFAVATADKPDVPAVRRAPGEDRQGCCTIQ
jgi:hypothetical protein